MNAHSNKHLPLLGGGIAAILVSGIAIASLAISAQGVNASRAAAAPPDAAAAVETAAPEARASYRCATCGVIESTREIEAADEGTGGNASGRIAGGNLDGIERKPARNYAITIRLPDGSMRVVSDAKPAKWRHGEQVTIIAGTGQ